MHRKLYIILFIVTVNLSCNPNEEDRYIPTGSLERISEHKFDTASYRYVVSNEKTTTRAFYSFNSENLTFLRLYQTGDYMFQFNPDFTPDLYMAYSILMKMSYRVAQNDFYGTFISNEHYKYGVGWGADRPKTDTMMMVLWDQNFTSLYHQQFRWNLTNNALNVDPTKPNNDTCIVVPLIGQLGTKEDAFSRQLPWCRYPLSRMQGTHVWNNLTAHYWLILLFDSTEVASIDTVRIHADEPMYDHVYWKYTGKLSYLNNQWGMVNGGPYAIGCDTIYPIEKGWKHADIFISFFPGEPSYGTFHNFGFEIGWTDKSGIHHNSTEKINQDNVRPQAKYAAAGNVYKDAMTLTLAHGLQNMYEDEVVEIDKWNTAVDSTIIVKKD